MLHLKIAKTMYEYMLADLSRSHDHAYERVGFLYVNKGTISENNTLLLASDYTPVADGHYIVDSKVGARINSQAIREVMQQVIEKGHGVFHVHLHNFVGKPIYSKTDIDNLRLLLPSFQNVAPQMMNGALLLQNSLFASLVWIPQNEDFEIVEKISIIGYPVKLFGRL